jgi:hypothetical protein
VPRAKVSQLIPATSSEVFDVLHDYARRLEWDTLLRAAYLDDGHTRAAKGATSVCVGRWGLGGFALKTEYISFDRPRVAAVKMLNRPVLFDAWAASIQHLDTGPGQSKIVYTFSFTSKPRRLSWLLDPILLKLGVDYSLEGSPKHVRGTLKSVGAEGFVISPEPMHLTFTDADRFTSIEEDTTPPL